MRTIFSSALVALALLTSEASPSRRDMYRERRDWYANFDLAPRQTTSPCPTGAHLMVAGGCMVPCSPDNPSLLDNLILNITTAIPGSSVYVVPYNDSEQQAMVSTPVMIGALESFVASCPNTPIVFIGYSLGGIVVMNTLCGGIGKTYVPNVIGAIVYGEETYLGNKSYDYGSCTNNAPDYPRNNSKQCHPYAPIIESYCDASDPECCTGGTLPLAHYEYTRYDNQSLTFITAQYSAYRLEHPVTTTTSSSSSTRSTTTTTTKSSSPTKPTTTTTKSTSKTSTTSTSKTSTTSTSKTSTTTKPTSTSTNTFRCTCDTLKHPCTKPPRYDCTKGGAEPSA